MSFEMTELKKKLVTAIDDNETVLLKLGDTIYDLAEISFEEVKSAELLTNYLEENGFNVERGIANLPTAFKAVYENGEGGPSIGLLCEYDALVGLGHGCGHHLQGPAIIGAALAVKESMKDKPYKLVVYGTPGEETDGGKIQMIEKGCFKDIDVALMTHGGPATQTDVKSMALLEADVIFKGTGAHAAITPEKGRSALDAMLLSFNGIEYLREHVKDDTRIHYTILESPGPANAVPTKAIGNYMIRSYNSLYVDKLVPRFEKIIQGACLMTETDFEINYKPRFESKVPSYILNDLTIENAKLVNAPTIKESREKTGSTDFGNVTYNMPGACIRVQFVPEGTASHTKEFVEAGKTKAGHDAIIYAAKILAMTSADLIEEPQIVNSIKAEFDQIKLEMMN